MIHYFILCRHTFWFTWGSLLPPCDDSNSTASLWSSLEGWDVDACWFVELTSTMLTSEFLIRYRILIWDRTIRSIGMNHAIINNIITYERSFKDGEKLSKVQPRKYAWNKWNIATSGYNYGIMESKYYCKYSIFLQTYFRNKTIPAHKGKRCE